MGIFQEREQKNLPDGLTERAEEISLPQDIERKEKVSPRASAFKSQVNIAGKPATQAPQNQKVVITLPADPAQLTRWSKGKITSAQTWLGEFFLMLIKKAKHFGWKVTGRA